MWMATYAAYKKPPSNPSSRLTVVDLTTEFTCVDELTSPDLAGTV